MDTDKIVNILKRYQSTLSDGYEYYVRHSAGPESDVVPTVDNVLKKIANEIIQALKKETVNEPVLLSETKEKVKESTMSYSHYRDLLEEDMAYMEDMLTLPELSYDWLWNGEASNIKISFKLQPKVSHSKKVDDTFKSILKSKTLTDNHKLSICDKKAIDRALTGANVKQEQQEWKFKHRSKNRR